jgi:hypothetical protein
MASPARGYPGHTPVRSGPGDWSCKCGIPLYSWRWSEGGPDEGYRIKMAGRRGAREAMRYHRGDLWMAATEGRAALAAAISRISRA